MLKSKVNESNWTDISVCAQGIRLTERQVHFLQLLSQAYESPGLQADVITSRLRSLLRFPLYGASGSRVAGRACKLCRENKRDNFQRWPSSSGYIWDKALRRTWAC